MSAPGEAFDAGKALASHLGVDDNPVYNMIAGVPSGHAANLVSGDLQKHGIPSVQEATEHGVTPMFSGELGLAFRGLLRYAETIGQGTGAEKVAFAAFAGALFNAAMSSPVQQEGA